MSYPRAYEDGSVSFFFPEEHHRSVSVTGNFCGWRTPGIPLQRAPGGWSTTVASVPPGDVVYKFIVDGRWVTDPINLTRENAHEDSNSLLGRGQRGTVLHRRIHAASLGESRAYTVYLPPSHGHTARRFPVLYLLHGALDWERTWLDKGELVATLERMFREGTLGELIVVMPFENGNLHRGDTRVADYLASDLVGHIDHEYATQATPESRALDGLSTGGFTSLVVGAWRPSVFRSIGSMSGSHDDRSHSAIRACAPQMREARQRFFVSGGQHEPHLDACRGVATALASAGLDPSWHDAPGGHDWSLWRGLLAAHLVHHTRHISR